jgi:alpha-galactosidase/6-phospho-beta-glucosidase family protein
VFRELDATHTVPPPSLARRDARWYPDAVVPAIVALTSITPQRLVMNVPRDRDVVVEVKADVSADAVVPVAAPRPNDRVAAWLDRFERHERAVLRAVAEPEVDSLLTALDADPMLTNVDVAPIARALCGCVQEESTPSWAFV